MSLVSWLHELGKDDGALAGGPPTNIPGARRNQNCSLLVTRKLASDARAIPSRVSGDLRHFGR